MRKIDDRIIEAIRTRKPLVYKSRRMGSEEYGVHDEVTITPHGFRLELIGTIVAELDGDRLFLGCGGFYRDTPVTVQRVNLACRALGVRSQLSRRDWRDGEAYTGRREFSLKELRSEITTALQP